MRAGRRVEDGLVQSQNAPVAQLDRVLGYEPRGREFESLRARHLFDLYGLLLTPDQANFVAASIEEIAKEVIKLPRHQRLALIRLLLDLDQPGTSDEIDAAWDQEIRARVKAVDEGRAVGTPYELIKKELAARFPPR